MKILYHTRLPVMREYLPYFIDSNDNAHWIQAYFLKVSNSIPLKNRQAYLNKKIELTMDYQCDIFQTMSDCDFDKEFTIDKNRNLLNIVTGQEGTPNRLLMEKVFAKIITDEVN